MPIDQGKVNSSMCGLKATCSRRRSTSSSERCGNATRCKVRWRAREQTLPSCLTRRVRSEAEAFLTPIPAGAELDSKRALFSSKQHGNVGLLRGPWASARLSKVTERHADAEIARVRGGSVGTR